SHTNSAAIIVRRFDERDLVGVGIVSLFQAAAAEFLRSPRNRRPDQTARHARAGFTFVELMLVLALLLVASSLVVPPVLRLMADQPLKEAAERARSQLANVRLKALDSSVAWQFRFEPGGRRYLWMPLEPSSGN